jgi:phage terminase large subunit
MTQKLQVSIPYNFKSRPYQRPFFEAMQHCSASVKDKPDAIRRAVLVWHRRAGKEKTCWNFMLMQAIQKVGTYYYFFPSFAQGRKVLWDFIDKDGYRVLDHLPEQLISGKPNATEMKIRLKNGSLIQIIGTNNIDSIVGTNPIGSVFSEYSLQDPTAWTLIRPILVENNGWAVFNFTPRGQNHGKELYDMAKTNPSWYCQLLTVNDTTKDDSSRIITDADIEAERVAGMSEDYIQQEFYCSFTLGVEGSYYAKYMQDARDENRVANVSWNKQSRVYTAWDIGFGDSTAIIFYQLVGKDIHIIDYYENHGEGLPHYAKVLTDKPYIYADHYAPHDIDSHSFSSGLSAREVGADLGLKFIPLPTLKLRLEDGIEAVRGIFPRVWIDEKKCKKLILGLENYRKEFDTNHNVYKMRPVHDWASHPADAMRYLAIAVKKYVDSNRGPSDDEVERLRNKYQPVFD